VSPFTDNYAHLVGQNMRAIRMARGLTLDQVDRAADGRFNGNLLGFWERGQKNAKVEDLDAYARWLGVDIRCFLPADPPHGEAEVS
jgi:transcriptional regulator with XRE-family HTH domain